MVWISQFVRGIIEALLSTYGHLFGKTIGTEARQDDGMLHRAGRNVRNWMRSRGSGDGG